MVGVLRGNDGIKEGKLGFLGFHGIRAERNKDRIWGFISLTDN